MNRVRSSQEGPSRQPAIQPNLRDSHDSNRSNSRGRGGKNKDSDSNKNGEDDDELGASFLSASHVDLGETNFGTAKDKVRAGTFIKPSSNSA